VRHAARQLERRQLCANDKGHDVEGADDGCSERRNENVQKTILLLQHKIFSHCLCILIGQMMHGIRYVYQLICRSECIRMYIAGDVASCRAFYDRIYHALLERGGFLMNFASFSKIFGRVKCTFRETSTD